MAPRPVWFFYRRGLFLANEKLVLETSQTGMPITCDFQRLLTS
jgi:hypothetical protein